MTQMDSLTPEHREVIYGLRRAYEHRLRTIIEAGQRRGDIRMDLEAKYLTLAMSNLVNWSIFWFGDSGDKLSVHEWAAILKTIFMDGARASRSTDVTAQG
jgi:hypothetical protein